MRSERYRKKKIQPEEKEEERPWKSLNSTESPVARLNVGLQEHNVVGGRWKHNRNPYGYKSDAHDRFYEEQRYDYGMFDSTRSYYSRRVGHRPFYTGGERKDTRMDESYSSKYRPTFYPNQTNYRPTVYDNYRPTMYDNYRPTVYDNYLHRNGNSSYKGREKYADKDYDGYRYDYGQYGHGREDRRDCREDRRRLDHDDRRDSGRETVYDNEYRDSRTRSHSDDRERRKYREQLYIESYRKDFKRPSSYVERSERYSPISKKSRSISSATSDEEKDRIEKYNQDFPVLSTPVRYIITQVGLIGRPGLFCSLRISGNPSVVPVSIPFPFPFISSIEDKNNRSTLGGVTWTQPQLTEIRRLAALGRTRRRG